MSGGERSGGDTVLDLVTLADARFALALAVFGRSILDHLRPGVRIRMHVIDGGITASLRDRVVASWDHRIEVTWHEPRLGATRRLTSASRVPILTLARLSAASLVPDPCRRALVLDADQLVLTDLTRLYDEAFGHAIVLAPRDVFIPTVSSPNGLADFARLGLPSNAPYLCGGLMVIDVPTWRRTSIEELARRFASEQVLRLRNYDQDALNAVLAGRWRILDPRWQVQPRALELSMSVMPQLDNQTRSLLARDPWVVHFSGRMKPWLYRGRSRFDALFRETLARTAFRGERPPSRVRDWIYRIYDGPLRRLAYPLEIRIDTSLRRIRSRSRLAARR